LERNERLQHLLLKLKRMQFGKKSERLPEEQLQLDEKGRKPSTSSPILDDASPRPSIFDSMQA